MGTSAIINPLTYENLKTMAMKELPKMKFFRTVETPMTPNFILVDGLATSVAEFTNQDLMKIGKLWTRKLVEKAERNRRNLRKD